MSQIIDEAAWLPFSSDAEEAIAMIEEALIMLESGGRDPAGINGLYRALHTVKGNSGFLGLKSLEHLAHSAEDLVGLVRDRGMPVSRELVSLLLAMVDRLRALVSEIGRTRADVVCDRCEQLVREAGELAADQGFPLQRAQVAVECLLFDDGAALASAEPSEDLAFFLALAVGSWESIRRGPPDAAVAAAELSQMARRLQLEPLGTLAAAVATGGQHQPALLQGLYEALGDVRSQFHRLKPDGESFDFLPPTAPGLPPTPGATAILRSLPAAAPSLRVKRLSRRPSLKPPAPVAAERAPAQQDLLRVESGKVSSLMELAGELGLLVNSVTRHPGLNWEQLEGFAALAHRLELMVTELQNETAALRLIAVGSVFTRMRRVARDACQRTGKQAELVLVGEDTEMDKVLVDQLQDPLMHVIRNAIDHGLELPEDRRAAGKSPVGRVTLAAAHEGGSVVVRISDDGRGMEPTRIWRRAVERGLVPEAKQLTEQEMIDLIFLPGFSTAEAVTELSGRGVGMDVVRSSIQNLRGAVSIATRPGHGTTLTLTLPLTLAFLEAMIVSASGWLLALPVERVQRVLVVTSDLLAASPDGHAVLLRLDDGLVPVLWLDEFYGASGSKRAVDGKLVAVVYSNRGRVALPVERLIGNQQVMLKPLSGDATAVRAAAGFGVLRSGDVALTLDCERLHA